MFNIFMLNLTDVQHFLKKKKKKTQFYSSPLLKQAWLSQRKLKQWFFRFSDNERRYAQGWCFCCGFNLNHMRVSHKVPCTLCSNCCFFAHYFPPSRTYALVCTSHSLMADTSIKCLHFS